MDLWQPGWTRKCKPLLDAPHVWNMRERVMPSQRAYITKVISFATEADSNAYGNNRAECWS